MPIQTTNLAPGATQVDVSAIPAGVTGEYLVTLEMSDAALLDPATKVHYGLEIQQPDTTYVAYTVGDVQGDPANGFDKFGVAITPERPNFTVPAAAVAGKTVRGTRRNDGTATVKVGVGIAKSTGTPTAAPK